MKFYTDRELAALLADGESHLVERKRSAANRSAIRRNICAFANDLPATGRTGVIFVGLEDDGTCAKITVDDELLTLLAQMRGDGNIMPLPTMTVDKKTLGGCELAVIQVTPAENPPVRYEGRVWIKVGPTVQLATGEDEHRLIERHRAANRAFDMRPSFGASLEDLNLEYIGESYLHAAIAGTVLEQNRRPLDQQLRSLRLVTQDAPSWASLIAFGKDPQSWMPGAYIQFVRFDGNSMTDPILNRKELTGGLFEVLSRAHDLAQINISVGTDISAGPREIRRPDYPLEALRQLTNNAVMHRNYESTNAPIRLYWFSDRIEIQSPGGLYGIVTPQNIHEGATDYRNPLIAEIMHNLGFAQRFGVGIQLAKDSLRQNGNPELEFAFSTTHTTVTMRPAR